MAYARHISGRPVCRCIVLAALAGLGFAAMGVPSAALEPGRESGSDPPNDSPNGRFPLQFHSERIRIEVRADSVEVDGLYRFLCMGVRRPAMTLLFPYPQDSMLGGAQTMLLEEIQADGRARRLRFEELGSDRGALWILDVPAIDTLVVRTVYRQHLHGCYARYIVTTTGFWTRPLVNAQFEVLLPPKVDTPSFSYPFQRDPERDPRSWFYEASDFLPGKDIEIRWDCSR